MTPGGFYYDSRYIYTEIGKFERKKVLGIEEIWLEDEEENGLPQD